jgi:hypothetical protein
MYRDDAFYASNSLTNEQQPININTTTNQYKYNHQKKKSKKPTTNPVQDVDGQDL